ncbi:U-box domain-containing protein 45-like [Rutidosis leptorrhynchoides]|uniref:U-box domain-containing protein 45-like n=1 Tax=Rutidosis leptorrhynchoides TaxID=125765 RepID=UPI003A98FBA5
MFESYEDLLTILTMEDEKKKLKAVEQIRLLTKEDEEARIVMGENGFVEPLLHFFESTMHQRNIVAQESAAMALFNLSVNNNRNKEMMLQAGVLPLLEDMIRNSGSPGAVAALYLNLSCLEQAKPIIGSSEAVPFLIRVLEDSANLECKSDALHALFHLSTCHSNISRLVSLGILNALLPLVNDITWTEKVLAVFISLVLDEGFPKDEIVSTHGLIGSISSVLDFTEEIVQEQAAACLLILCTKNEKCIQMVLQEGVIPSLVSISANGTERGKQMAQKLLMLFREQRHRDPPTVYCGGPQECEIGGGRVDAKVKSLTKQASRRKMGRAWSSLWRNKSFLVNQC